MSETGLNNIPFTYYGDLLGVSDFYKISEKEGYKELNKFYNIIYKTFGNNIDTDIRIFVFSDSLFITGHHLQDVLNKLGSLYIELLKKRLLIKGAIAGGLLEFDPRLELENLQKMLPTSNILFRAVALEKIAEGIRLVIEKNLAQKILPEELYGIPPSYEEEYRRFKINEHSILRKIKWTSDLNAYDFLWLDYGIGDDTPYGSKYWIMRLNEIKPHVNKKAQIHYTETIKLIKRFYRY